MRITFDPVKRADAGRTWTGFRGRGADLRRCHGKIENTRRSYGEKRIICYGLLAGRVVVVGYTPCGVDRHVFSMKKANEREKAHVAPRFEV